MANKIIPNRILYVEDETLMRELLENIFRKEGISCDISDSGEKALLMIADSYSNNQPYAAVLTDLKMPGISGIDLLQAIKTNWSQLPVVIITAFGTKSTEVEALRIGAEDFLIKPINMETLIIKIRRIIANAKSENMLPLKDDDHVLTVKRLLREKNFLSNQVMALKEELSIAKAKDKSVSSTNLTEDLLINKVGELIRPIIHDIKLPLAAMSASMYLFEQLSKSHEAKFDEKINTVVDIFKDNIELLELQIDELRFLGQYSNREFVKVDIHALIKAFVFRMTKHKKIKIILKLCDQPIEMVADILSLDRIIKNLVTNAIEACEPDKGVVTLSTKLESKTAQLIVQDNGHGISDHIKDKIYDLSFTTKKAGFGIGLYLVKKAVELHKGSIECISIPEKGSTFIVNLPMSPVEE